MNTKTWTPRAAEIERNWYVVDAEGQTLGRLATKIVAALLGKGKPTYADHLDTGDFVIVVNAEKIRVTGKKLDEDLKQTGYIAYTPDGKMLVIISHVHPDGKEDITCYTGDWNVVGEEVIHDVEIAARAPWWTLVGPALMTFLLVRVSGVTLLERDLCESKAGYRAYVERTSSFVPWFPRGR